MWAKAPSQCSRTRAGATADGQAILELLVSPTLGEVDEAVVGEAFLQEIAKSSIPSDRMVEIWRDSGTLRVVRQSPVISKAGKILHLHRLQRIHCLSSS